METGINMKIHKNTNSEAPLIPIKRDESGRQITVFLTPYKSGERRNFRCVNCSRIQFQYESEVGMIIDSEQVPEDRAPIEVLCSQCKILYLILW